MRKKKFVPPLLAPSNWRAVAARNWADGFRSSRRARGTLSEPGNDVRGRFPCAVSKAARVPKSYSRLIMHACRRPVTAVTPRRLRVVLVLWFWSASERACREWSYPLARPCARTRIDRPEISSRQWLLPESTISVPAQTHRQCEPSFHLQLWPRGRVGSEPRLTLSSSWRE